MPDGNLSMGLRRTLFLFLTFFLLVNARQRAVQHPSGRSFSDTFSYSQPERVTTRHLELDLTIEPVLNRIYGRVTLDIENLSGTRTLILDTFKLQIAAVTRDGVPAAWSLGSESEVGQPLIIDIEPATRFVTIDYLTTNSPPSPTPLFQQPLFWLSVEATLAGKNRFAYSLNEPLGARAWIPLQDTPVVRTTYDATLHVPPGMLALMGAEGNPTAINDTGVYTFHMPKPIPSYLIAFAVGRLEFRAFDGRTGVYAEPELMDEAFWELQSLPDMMDIAEEIAGPFPFARHDVLIMPPGFPAGGMEHPMLNFLSHTSAVIGDHAANPPPKRLIAHELAHSWAGDAVTLASWNDLWLNEGMARYMELRILEEMRDAELTEFDWANLRAAEEAFTMLHRPVTFAAEGFDTTSYDKGALFMRTIEDHLGRAAFDQFLRDYFESMRWRSIDTAAFFETFHDLVQPSAALLADLRLEEWAYQPGLPSNVTTPGTSPIHARMLPRIVAFQNGASLAQLSPGTWSETEINYFFSRTQSAHRRARMAEIDAALSPGTMHTPPRLWLVDVVTARHEPGMAAVERVLLRGEPRAWLFQIYDLLNRWNPARARDIFQRARAGYFPYYSRQLSLLLGGTNSNTRTLLKEAA